jgi:hypothetical protein
MKLFSVAIGTKYEREAERLKRSVPLPVEVFTESSEKYKRISEDPLIDGLWHKCNFANYIDEADGPVIFMDADMFTLTENPFETFNVKEDTDFAYVSYQCKWYFPDTIRQEAFNHHGHKINSGFMYFKNLEIAQNICTKWAEEFLKRPLHWIKNEYDEYALMIALMNMSYKIELLDSKWNDWELGLKSFEEKSPESILNSNSIFFQSHDFLNIV